MPAPVICWEGPELLVVGASEIPKRESSGKSAVFSEGMVRAVVCPPGSGVKERERTRTPQSLRRGANSVEVSSKWTSGRMSAYHPRPLAVLPT